MREHALRAATLASAALVLTTGLTITSVIGAGPAQAKPVYMKLGDIKGEAATARERDKWIEIMSVQLGAERASGVHVATGDVDGDGHADHAGHHHGSDASAGKGARGERADGGGGPAVKGRAAIAPGVTAPEPVPAGLLLPAVQKVREATARGAALTECKAGQKLPTVAIRNSDDGRTGRILDATLTGCAGEEVSFNFTKIEWD